MATLTQMMNLTTNQLEWVCKHLGHAQMVHKEHYRQMSSLIERVYVTKLLILQDKNLTNRFKGQDLMEVDLQDVIYAEVDKVNAPDVTEEGEHTQDMQNAIAVSESIE
jgi:hypothetical protein